MNGQIMEGIQFIIGFLCIFNSFNLYEILTHKIWGKILPKLGENLFGRIKN